jgi:3,4-dihydroxy 2-butanone 4-phosphate synthase/GTP cyclohydrolase II
MSAPAAATGLATVEDAVAALQRRSPVIVVDTARSRVIGHVVVGAADVSADQVNFMARQARGIVCVALTAERCAELQLAPPAGRLRCDVSLMASIESRRGVTTGISAHDRAVTIRTACGSGDLVSPGHIVPLRAADRGTLQRPRYAEAGVDLARCAGLKPAAAVCAILDDAGDVAGIDALLAFADEHALPAVAIGAIARRRRAREPLELLDVGVRGVLGLRLRDAVDLRPRLVLCARGVEGARGAAIYVHRRCREDLHPISCGCRSRLDAALRGLADGRLGVVILVGEEPLSADREQCLVDQVTGVLGIRGARRLPAGDPPDG